VACAEERINREAVALQASSLVATAGPMGHNLAAPRAHRKMRRALGPSDSAQALSEPRALQPAPQVG
jgi:hypothetical protein